MDEQIIQYYSAARALSWGRATCITLLIGFLAIHPWLKLLCTSYTWENQSLCTITEHLIRIVIVI